MGVCERRANSERLTRCLCVRGGVQVFISLKEKVCLQETHAKQTHRRKSDEAQADSVNR